MPLTPNPYANSSPEITGGVTPAPTPGTVRISPTADQTFQNAMTFGVPFTLAGMVDTMGQSVGLFDDNTMTNTLRHVFPGGGGDFYANNKETFRQAGEIVGLPLPGIVGAKLIRSVRFLRESGKLGEFLKSSTAADALLGNSAALTLSERKVYQSAQTAALSQGMFSGRTFAVPAVEAAKRSYFATRAVETVRQTAIMEAAYRTLYNDSETFYPADYTLSDELKWAGAGLAIGGGLDFAVGRYAARKLLQSAGNDVRKLTEGIDLSSQVVFRPGNRGVGITFYSAQKAQLSTVAKVSSDPTLVSNIAQDRTSVDGIIVKNLIDMGNDAHEFLPKASFTKDSPQMKLALTALDKNDQTFLFATKLGQVPEDAAEFFGKQDNAIKGAQAKLDELIAERLVRPLLRKPGATDTAFDEAQARLAELKATQSEVHYVIENTGDFSVYRTRAPNWMDQNGFDNIKQKTTQEALNPDAKTKDRIFTPRVEYSTGPGSKWILDNNFVLSLSEDANELDRSAAFAAASKVIPKWKPVENQQNFIVNEKLPWFQLEAVHTLVSQKPEAMKFLQMTGEIKSLDDLQFEIVDQKFQDFVKLTKRAASASSSSIRAFRQTALSQAEIVSRLNLPQNVGMRPHPLVELFSAVDMQGHKTLEDALIKAKSYLPSRDLKMDILQAAMRETADAAPGTKFETAGKLFLQKDIKPLFVAATSIPALSRTDAMLHGMVETQRDLALARLAEIDPNDAPIARAVLDNTLNSGALTIAKDVRSLYDGVASGRGNVVFQDRINEQFATLKALSLQAQSNEKLVETLVGALAKQRLTPLMADMLKNTNKNVLFDFNRIEQSYRHGWDIKEVEREGDAARFVLNNTEHNDNMFKQYFGKTFADAVSEDGETVYMPDMSVTARKAGQIPLRVSSSAADVAEEISNLSRQSGVEINALKVALGKPNVKIRDFHLPTPELFREDTYFIRNAQGRVVSTYTGGTLGQNKTRAEEAARKLQEITGEAHVALPLDEVRRQHNLFDSTFFDIIDYSDQLAKTGLGIKGGLVRSEIDTGPETLKAMVMSLNEQFLQAGTRAQAAVFEPQLNFAEQASQTLGKSLTGPNIFDRYQAIIFNRAPTTREQVIPALYGRIDSALDHSLSWLYARYTEALAGTEAGKAGARSMRQVLRNQTSDKEFKEMQRSMGDAAVFSPFQTTQDWLESTYRETQRLSSRNYAARLSLLTSTMALRFLDVGTSVLNLAGVATTAPAIVASMRKLPEESIQGWLKRTAAYGSTFGDNPQIATFSPLRALGKAVSSYWNGELNEPMARAAKMGYFDPEYSALAKILTDPKFGGPNHFDTWINKASWLADKSEVLSRKLAWGMGYKIGRELHQFKDERNAFIYANNFMNEMIGNYNPRNKPAMFRGAVGLPLGAFQTYMFNFYRRMYGYLERKDVSSLAAAYATQASVFGASSVPGWGLFNSAVLSNYDGSDSLSTRLDRKFSPGVSELLMHGALSSVPAIFGQGGIALYPRGSTDFTQLPPTVLDYGRAPPILFLQNVWDGIGKTVNNVFGAGGFSVQQQEEILANMSTNRAFKSIMEFAANAKTDRLGNVIDMGTRDAIHVAASLLGTVPSRARELQDRYNAQQVVELHQANLRAQLNEKTRAVIRGGELSVDRLQDFVQSYTKSGGNPAYFGEWLRNTMETAIEPKAQRAVAELARSGRWIEFLNMLGAMQQNSVEAQSGKTK